MYSQGYDENHILQQVSGFVREECPAPLEKTVKLLSDTIDYYDWVGIYVVEGEYLVLGPFVGEPTEHTRILATEGICGAAVVEKKTMVIQDVLSDPRHIACSTSTRSEIVVPIWVGDRVAAEIDVDSNTPNAFTDWDKSMLEKAAELLSKCFE